MEDKTMPESIEKTAGAGCQFSLYIIIPIRLGTEFYEIWWQPRFGDRGGSKPATIWYIF
jgi:hypothetical protein